MTADDHAAPKVSAKVKGRRVGYLTDGWTPYDPDAKKSSWYVKEILLGLVICFTQIPETVAFALIANVDPTVGIHATWMLGLICATFGGRPAMINGASGAFAAMVHTFLPEPVEPKTSGEGIEYLFPSVIVAGVLMILISVFKLSSKLINIIGSTILIGFCDGLAIVIGKSQIHHLEEVHGTQLYWTLLMVFVSMVTMEFVPKLGSRFPIFKVLPSALLAILFSVAIEYGLVRPISGHESDTIGDVAKFSKESAFPKPFWTNPMFDYKNNFDLDKKGWIKIFYQGFMLAMVGTIESLLTVKVVDGYTGTLGNGDRQVLAMGFGNITVGLLSGMGGTAMIGLSTISGLNGGEGRICSLTTGLMVMIAVMGAYKLLNVIPVASLIGIIFVVVYHTFKWFTFDLVLFAILPPKLVTKLGLPHRKVNRSDVLVIVTVIVITLLTNLFFAVIGGIVLSIIIFAIQVKASGKPFIYVWRAFTQEMSISKKSLETEDTIVYIVRGPLFFGSFRTFMTLFTPDQDPPNVVIYMEDGRIYDYSSLEALNKVCKDFKSAGKSINVMNLSEKSKRAIRRADGQTGLTGCCSKFNFSWILGDIEIASEDDDDTLKDDVVKLADMESTENTFGYDKGFYVNASPDAYVFT